MKDETELVDRRFYGRICGGRFPVEGTTCYCDPDAEAEISRRLVPEPGERMRWIDSGDYHYVTKILAAREQAPFTLVLVDNHPDDQAPAFGGVLSCGSWVRDLREASPMLEEVWTLGPDHRIRNAPSDPERFRNGGPGVGSGD